MKKRIASALLASAVILSVAGCGTNTPATTTAAAGGNDAASTTAAAADTTAADNGGAAPAGNVDNSGTTFNIRAWNEEFKGFFEKYMPGYDAAAQTLDGV
ncbi:MAG: hypothetical protein J6N15_09290, partial [Ruminiclostridium sp.]|nr:hypothetical protein [Ruminiclostridium sp.]